MSEPVAVRVYPVGLRISRQRAVVVGGGAVAARKVEGLCAARANVLVVAPHLAADGLRRRVEAGDVAWEQRPYQSGDLEGAVIVFAATDQADVNRAVHRDATTRGLWINVADAPDLCTFDVPSSFRRPDDASAPAAEMCIAVFSGGASPAFAAFMRRELERALKPEHVALLQLAARIRAALPIGERDLTSRLMTAETLTELASRNRIALRARLERDVGAQLTADRIDAILSEVFA